MIDKSMKIRLLPASLIIKNFVDNEPLCNYENYLIELLNSSKWFQKEYPGTFMKPKSESNGECDAINENYQIDFKLFASTTIFKAKSDLSDRIIKINDGIIAQGDSKKKGSQTATNLHVVIKDVNLFQINETTLYNSDIIEDIQNVIRILKIKKNIFLFFPYIFSFEKAYNTNKAIKCIIEGLEYSFKNAFEYRKVKVPNYDTFLSCIYNDNFIIFKIINNSLILCDRVDTSSLTIFYKLMNDYGTTY